MKSEFKLYWGRMGKRIRLERKKLSSQGLAFLVIAILLKYVFFFLLFLNIWNDHVLLDIYHLFSSRKIHVNGNAIIPLKRVILTHRIRAICQEGVFLLTEHQGDELERQTSGLGSTFVVFCLFLFGSHIHERFVLAFLDKYFISDT